MSRTNNFPNPKRYALDREFARRFETTITYLVLLLGKKHPANADLVGRFRNQLIFSSASNESELPFNGSEYSEYKEKVYVLINTLSFTIKGYWLYQQMKTDDEQFENMVTFLTKQLDLLQRVYTKGLDSFVVNKVGMGQYCLGER